MPPHPPRAEYRTDTETRIRIALATRSLQPPHLRRIGRDYGFNPPGDPDTLDFGIFMGEHDGHYYVFVKDLLTARPIGYYAYDELDDLKADWELDR